MKDWRFGELKYERPDFDAFAEFMKDKTGEIKNALCPKDVLRVIGEVDECDMELSSAINTAQIRHTLDTTDKFYEEEINCINQALPKLQQHYVEYGDALMNSAYRKDIEDKYGQMFFVGLELSKKSFCEANIPLMQREAVLTDEYQKIMATAQIDFKGEKLNLYGIQKYFEDDDREVRRQAFRAYSDFYSANEPRLEEIWDELIRVRNEMGRNLGFENYIPLGYLLQGRTDYGQEEVASYREQVREVLVPFCEKLYRAQAKRLGLDRVCVFDEKKVFADGNAHPAGDDDFMVRRAQEMYHLISPETGEFIDFMIDHELMDLKNKPGKASTGYMTELPSYRAPYVFSCFNGTTGDMQVLTHELGHAFAGYMAMRNQPISAFFSETTDIAEIHSMTMEQFAYPYAQMFFGDDADKYRFSHLQEALTFVPFGVAVDEFQHICYANPGLSPKERTYEWHKLERKYMPWRVYEDDEFMERGGFWYHKLHIYLYPMYYINYTLTTLGAMEFKTKDHEDHVRAWRDYLNLCKCGGSLSYLETLKYANLDSPFEAGSVEKACAYAMETLLKQLEKFE
ncbi:MAG: M3 family oligoendopeptidase [Lachnospiraceae bacterium]|nr:M3 family oligoendopeptidase [Lachnospiraceae bacterium]